MRWVISWVILSVLEAVIKRTRTSMRKRVYEKGTRVLVEEGKSDRLVRGIARRAPATDEIGDEDHDDQRRETHADNDRNYIRIIMRNGVYSRTYE